MTHDLHSFPILTPAGRRSTVSEGFSHGRAPSRASEILRGDNAHHQCETIFKAFARALRMALTLDARSAGVIPSTKGTL